MLYIRSVAQAQYTERVSGWVAVLSKQQRSLTLTNRSTYRLTDSTYQHQSPNTVMARNVSSTECSRRRWPSELVVDNERWHSPVTECMSNKRARTLQYVRTTYLVDDPNFACAHDVFLKMGCRASWLQRFQPGNDAFKCSGDKLHQLCVSLVAMVDTLSEMFEGTRLQDLTEQLKTLHEEDKKQGNEPRHLQSFLTYLIYCTHVHLTRVASDDVFARAVVVQQSA